MSWPARLTTLSWMSDVAPRVLRNLCMASSFSCQEQQAAFQPRRSALPARRDEAALAVAGERDVGRIERIAIPQLARHLLVLLVERLAVVGELAAPDLAAAALADLAEPVRVREALARRCDEVGVAARQDRLG